MRVAGHKLMELTNEGGGGIVNGKRERGRGRERHLVERSWTSICQCGAQESCRTKADTLVEFTQHLHRVKEKPG